MALVDVIMPQMGESIAEGTISKWHKKVGEKIAKDETLLEISTDKVDSEIPAPAAGIIAELLFQETTTVGVNTVIARINTDVNASVAQPRSTPAASPVPSNVQQQKQNGSAGVLIDVIMPQMGESIAEGTIAKWHKKVGDTVAKDETLLEISTDKVDSEIPAPAAGIIAELLFPAQTTVSVNTVIAKIATGSGAVVAAVPSPVIAPSALAPTAPIAPLHTPAKEAIPSDRFYSPLVLNIARTEGVSMGELEGIAGTGANGRVSKNDILSYIQRKKGGAIAAPIQRTAAPISSVPSAKSAAPITYPAGRVDLIKMDTMRKAIAEHMVRSKHTSAHVGSLSEADLTGIVKFREKNKAAFEKREGFNLTYTPFFLEAVVKAIKDFPMMNSSVDGDTIIIRKDVNLGVAVALENGLIVPVIKNAEQKNLAGIARSLNDLATRARNKKLLPDEVTGGTFTVTNPGGFGNLYGFPIINQPQVAILGVGAIKKRPVVIDDAIAIRSMVYISMSYDHRIIDGALGGMFMQKVVSYLENFDVTQAI
jgi:pyruvate dehydrogenase E2 component (dihydrolipoamide acetyltransferase)